jgi:hypothetical protein
MAAIIVDTVITFDTVPALPNQPFKSLTTDGFTFSGSFNGDGTQVYHAVYSFKRSIHLNCSAAIPSQLSRTGFRRGGLKGPKDPQRPQERQSRPDG